jgi:hypothetical protein
MFLVPNIDQMYKEMKKIVGRSVDRKHTYFLFFLA